MTRPRHWCAEQKEMMTSCQENQMRKKKFTFCKGSNEDCIAEEKTANGKNMFL